MKLARCSIFVKNIIKMKKTLGISDFGCSTAGIFRTGIPGFWENYEGMETVVGTHLAKFLIHATRCANLQVEMVSPILTGAMLMVAIIDVRQLPPVNQTIRQFRVGSSSLNSR